MTSEQSGGSRRTMVAFDFDGTLATSDSVVPFMRRVAGSVALAGGLVRRSHRLVLATIARDRHRIRTIGTEVAFSGRAHADVSAQARSFADHLVDHRLRSDTVARLSWHLEQGHETVIVSASYEDYLRPVAERLGIDHVIGSRLQVVDGRCTGRLDGANCRGPEKVRRLEEWLDVSGRSRDDVEVWAYGDSPGDRDMLRWADRAVWVKQPLSSVAPTP